MGSRTIVVTAGTPQYIRCPANPKNPSTIYCTPGGSGDVTVSFSGQEVLGDMTSLRYIAHPDVSAASAAIFVAIDSSATAIKLEAGTSDGTFDICSPGTNLSGQFDIDD